MKSWHYCRSSRLVRWEYWWATAFFGPPENPARGHRQLALELEGWIPRTDGPLYFFHEIDEGLWFYLSHHRLLPVPGSQPRYSDSFDKIAGLLPSCLPLGVDTDPSFRLLEPQKAGLLAWLAHPRVGRTLAACPQHTL